MVDKGETQDARVSFHALKSLLRKIFVNNGTAAETADILAENCAACERDGALSHGIFRMPGYVDSLRSGWVDGLAVPDATRLGSSFIRIDARNGFAQRALAAANPLIGSAVRETGIAVAAIRNSHHFSALWPDVEPFALSGHYMRQDSNSFTDVYLDGKSAGGLDRTRLNRVLEFMSQNIDADISLEELASVACLSVYHFARAFKLATGSAPFHYFTDLRLSRAKALLIDPGKTVEDVAFSTGFSSGTNFARAFKKSVGVSPTRFRNDR